MKTSVRKRLLFAGVSVLLLLLLLSLFQTAFWSRDYARAQALHEVIQFCQQSGRDPALLSGPVRTRSAMHLGRLNGTSKASPVI